MRPRYVSLLLALSCSAPTPPPAVEAPVAEAVASAVQCVVGGAIGAKYAALGGTQSFLGRCLTNELTTPDGVGRFNHFEHGSIYWTPATGAHEVHGIIRAKWESMGWERSVLRYPITDEGEEAGWRVSRFEGGAIYWSLASGAFEVHGTIWQRYLAEGGAAGALGPPASDELPTTGADRKSEFANGTIFWDAATNATRVELKGAPRSPQLRKVYTEHLGRLTDTATNPIRNVGLAGTDLGVSFERDGQLVFLFGDSWLTGTDRTRWDDDSVAFASPRLPEDGSLPKLTWWSDGAGKFRTLKAPGVALKGMNVPVEGVAVDARTYVFFSTGWSSSTQRHTHSVLAHTTGTDFAALVTDHVVPSDKFINVSSVRVGNELFLYGSGAYRASAVYLARVGVTSLADRNSWRYLSGFSNGQPVFSAGEGSAIPVVNVTCVGELSVRKHPVLDLLLMAYNCGSPRGINLHQAARPEGPWSAATVIFDPGADADHGYEHFIHASRAAIGRDDGLSEPDRDTEWGGEYGPYLVPQWFSSSGGVHSIVYLLSSWNPYQVHLVRTVFAEPGVNVPLPSKGAGLPKAALVNGTFAAGDLSGWQQQGTPFGLFTGTDGLRRLTTFVPPAGDEARGSLWQDFHVDASTSELRFAVHGGLANVRLWEGPNLIREVRGQRSNADFPVLWRLSEARGKTLRLAISDEVGGPWGFVGSTGFELR